MVLGGSDDQALNSFNSSALSTVPIGNGKVRIDFECNSAKASCFHGGYCNAWGKVRAGRVCNSASFSNPYSAWATKALVFGSEFFWVSCMVYSMSLQLQLWPE